jgi:hypothetical protein
LFLLVVNAALLGITASLTDRLQVDGLGPAILGGLLLAGRRLGGRPAHRAPLTPAAPAPCRVPLRPRPEARREL